MQRDFSDRLKRGAASQQSGRGIAAGIAKFPQNREFFAINREFRLATEAHLRVPLSLSYRNKIGTLPLPFKGGYGNFGNSDESIVPAVETAYCVPDQSGYDM